MAAKSGGGAISKHGTKSKRALEAAELSSGRGTSIGGTENEEDNYGDNQSDDVSEPSKEVIRRLGSLRRICAVCTTQLCTSLLCGNVQKNEFSLFCK